MKLPKTTKEKPYIEFSIDKKGKIKLSASSSWWGGKNAFFWDLMIQKEILVNLKTYKNTLKLLKKER